MVLIERIDDAASFDRLRPEWTALAAAGAPHNVFLTWEWLRPWWRHLSEGRRLCLLAVRSDSALVALLPLCARTRSLGRVVPALELLGTGMVGSDYLDALVMPGFDEAASLALAEELGCIGAPLALRGVATGATHLARTLELLGQRGWLSSSQATEQCPFMSIEGHSFDSYLASLGSKHRYTFRKKLRDLTSEHGLDWRAVASHEERREVLEALYGFHDVRWSPEGGSDAFSGEAIRAFHEEVTRTGLESGGLRLFALRLDGRVVAVAYGFRRGRTFSFYQMGWDRRHAPLSLGVILTGLVIRAAIDEGAGEFDFLHGSEAYKFHWTQQTRGVARFEAYPPGVLGVALRGAAGGVRAARQAARRVLPGALATALVSARRYGLWRALRASALR